MHLLLFSFLYHVYFHVVTSHKILFSCVSMFSLSCSKVPKMKLVKTLLCTQLKQTNLEKTLHISTKSPKEGFNDTLFHDFWDELKHKCNVQTDMQLFPVFLCLYSMLLVVILLFRVIFFHVFSFISFPCEFTILSSRYKIYL